MSQPISYNYHMMIKKTMIMLLTIMNFDTLISNIEENSNYPM